MPAFTNFNLSSKNTVVNEEAKKAVMHASSTATTHLGDYNNEYILVLRMTEDGTKMHRFEEFVDIKYSTEVLLRLREHLAAKQKKGT